MYPITQLFHERSKELKLSKHDAVQRAGYRNIGKGLRRLDSFLASGTDTGGNIISSLPAILELPPETVAQALHQTSLQLAREKAAAAARRNTIARESHKPFLFAATERNTPAQITICGLVGGDRLRYLDLPEGFTALSPAAQTDCIRSAIASCLAQHHGHVPFFGRIKHFILSRESDEPVHERTVFDLTGSAVPAAPDAMKHISAGHTRVTLSGKPNARIDGMLACGHDK